MSDFIVDGCPGLDDPVWEYVLESRVRPYIETVREWWANVHEFTMVDTGIAEIPCEHHGLYVRFTRTAVRSPIKGIQAFPFIPTSRLQITGVQGGSTKMVERVCLDNRFQIDEFTLVCKINLPSVFNMAQFIAIVPTDILNETKQLGIWLYFTKEECALLAQGLTNKAIELKALLKA